MVLPVNACEGVCFGAEQRVSLRWMGASEKETLYQVPGSSTINLTSNIVSVWGIGQFFRGSNRT